MLIDILKYLVFWTFKVIGVYSYLRYKNRDKIIVLTYHGVLPKIPLGKANYEYRNFVTVSQFEKQIRFLLQKYKPLIVRDLYESKKNNGSGFLITFDDGFRNNYWYAMPVLKKYGLQGCFFITTKLIGSGEFLWTEEITFLIEHTMQQKVELVLDKRMTFDLSTENSKEKASEFIRKYMKGLSPEKRNEILDQLKTQLSDVSLAIGTGEEDRYLFMNWDEVRDMIKNGQIIGSHTHTHPILSTLSDKDSYEELQLSKELIEKNAGRECLTMSYPNGESQDFTETQRQQLKELGYRCAFTQIADFNNSRNDIYELRRFNITSKMSMPVFEATLCGFKKG